MVELADWLRARGATVSDAVGEVGDDPVASFAGERGTVATRAVAQGEVLLDLPIECCMNVEEGSEACLDHLKETLSEACIDARDAALALALAQEMELGEESIWWPYVRTLGGASIGETFPCFFNAADLEALQNPTLAESMAMRAAAGRKIASAMGLDEGSFMNALQMVQSRRFASDVGRFMLPIGDLLNHSFDPTCQWEPPTPGGRPYWRLTALKAMGPGESINWKYSSDPNHLLLQTSGFIVPGNPFSRIMVRPQDMKMALAGAAISSPPEVAAWRSNVWEQKLPDAEPGSGMLLLSRVKTGGVMWNPLWLELCGFAVTRSQAPDEVPFNQRPGGNAEFCSCVEKATWSLFGTSPQQDLEALEAGGLSANESLALQFRLDQKGLVDEALGALRAKLGCA